MKAKLISSILALVLISSCAAPHTVTETETDATVAPTVPEPGQKTPVEYIVQTDYSGLTKYTREPDIYTRLSDSPMPELVPSSGYGPLLPYVGTRVYGISYVFIIQKYGLVTLDGMIVTDAVYTRASLEHSPNGENAVYLLRVPKPDGSGDGYSFYNDSCTVCAADGSWIIHAAYAEIITLDSVLLAKRTYESGAVETVYDIDVYDYSGRLLYNILDLPCADKLDAEKSYELMRVVSGDYLTQKLTSGEVVYIHLPTGEVTYTEYDEARHFSDGMSAVRMGAFWGYLGEKLDCVIEPQYYLADDFINGRAAVVNTAPVSTSVIDKTGAELFGISDSVRLMADYSGEYYNLLDAQQRIVAYYTADFVKIPAEIDGNAVYYAGNGYFSYAWRDGAMLIASDGTRLELPGVTFIYRVEDELAYCSDADGLFSVMTMSGETVIPAGRGFINKIANTGLLYAGTAAGVTVYNPDGSEFARCRGIPGFTTAFGMLGVSTETEFYYLDQNGDTVFRISLMATSTD